MQAAGQKSWSHPGLLSSLTHTWSLIPPANPVSRIQPLRTTSAITTLVQALLALVCIIIITTIISLPTLPDQQCILFKIAIRSWCASTQHPPVPSHLTKVKHRSHQDLQGPTMTWPLPTSLHSSPEMLSPTCLATDSCLPCSCSNMSSSPKYPQGLTSHSQAPA